VGAHRDDRRSSGDLVNALQVGVVLEAFADQPLAEVLDWLRRSVPDVTQVEIGSGGYAPRTHCDLRRLLDAPDERRRWQSGIASRGLSISALNAWGNPLHPDADVAGRHAANLRDTIRLAAELGVDRVIALAGCPAASAGDASPHFAAGGWLPYLEDVWERQWQDVAAPFWSGLADFARREHPALLVCLELHPGTMVYNVDTFGRLAELGDNLAANLDPSHFFWQSMDAIAVIQALAGRIGYCHAKDVRFIPGNLALNGVMDRRWPNPPHQMPWNFAIVGRGQGRDVGWWCGFVAALARHTRARTLSIEHEDPFVPAVEGVPAAASLLGDALRALPAASATPP
jgi:sugar phosphate isomerase/epimerase